MKPRRPEYPPSQKFVLVSELYHHWDLLDRYYRGEIQNLKAAMSKLSNTKKVNSSGRIKGALNSKDKMVPLPTQPSICPLSANVNKDDKLQQGDIGSSSLEVKKKRKSKDTKLKRHNFKVKCESQMKNRVAVSNHLKNSKSLRKNLLKHEIPYKPPTAHGLNPVHNSKILFHKNDASKPLNAATLAVIPKELPSNLFQTVLAPAPHLSQLESCKNNDQDNEESSPSVCLIPNVTKPSVVSADANKNSTIEQASFCPPLVSLKLADFDTTKPSSTKKSPIGNHSTSTAENLQQRPSNSEQYCSFSSEADLTEGKPRKLANLNKNGAACLERPQSVRKLLPQQKQTSQIQNNPSVLMPPPLKPALRTKSVGLTYAPPDLHAIIHAMSETAAKMNPFALRPEPIKAPTSSELRNRKKRREMERNQRKSYIERKTREEKEKESILISMMAFEMIWDGTPLSPIRSPSLRG